MGANAAYNRAKNKGEIIEINLAGRCGKIVSLQDSSSIETGEMVIIRTQHETDHPNEGVVTVRCDCVMSAYAMSVERSKREVSREGA